MRIDTEQLAQHLERGLRPLYVVYGDEPLLALEAADRIRTQARAEGYVEREVITIEAAGDWARLSLSSSSLSLFGARRLLDLRIPSGKP
ncbi:MAG: DNA polymerase III subunit delta, partial [Burkholderiales bacterium]|nr:DNA polymerase III subunit delta [Burkholderiales bacterium]